MNICVHCQKSEQEIPLVVLQYQGESIYLCSHCFPTLLHSPAKLADKIQGAEKFGPAGHDN